MQDRRTFPLSSIVCAGIFFIASCRGGYIATGTAGSGAVSTASTTVTIKMGTGVCASTLQAVGWADVAPVFAAHCTKCHSTTLTTPAARSGANPNYNFDTYEAASASTADGAAQMDWTLQDNMPPPGNAYNLTMVGAQEMCLLDEWVRGGTPNQAGKTAQVTLEPNNMCATGNTTFKFADVSPIFNAHCTGCHSSTLTGAARSGAAVGVNFDTQAGAIDAVQNNVALSDWDQPMNMPPPGNVVHAQAINDMESCVLDSWARQLPAQ